jgi:hypothetical protein
MRGGGAGTVLTAWLARVGLLAALAVAALPAAADPYRVEMVPVDAQAEDAVAARELAIAQGQREGLVTVMRRLTTTTALPDVSRVDLDRIVVSHEIADEQLGATRYVGHINVTYDRGEVERLLREAGLPFVVVPPGPILVVPALDTARGYDLWSDDNPWRAAWLSTSPPPGLLELIVPLGDIADLTMFTGDDLARGNAAALGRLAQRYDASAAYVVTATLGGDAPGTGPVRLQVLGPELNSVAIDEATAEAAGDVMEAAVARAAAAIEAAWKRENVVRADRVAVLEVEVPLVDLRGWVQIRDGLEGLPWVRRLRIDELGRRRAALTIEYIGDFPRLEDALADLGLGLTRENGGWRLLPAGGVNATEAPSMPPVPSR